jgi:small-conductance mechanosensitive channel
VRRDKSELEGKVRELEAMVIAGGGSLSSGGSGGSQVSSAELARLTQQNAEQLELIHMLQRQMEEFQDLEEAKAAYEEYQQHSTQELDEGLAKLEDEKQVLQNERYKILKDRSQMEEKEARMGQLITNLDEKESKLRQMMGTMKEQQDQWQRSITDLQVRWASAVFVALCSSYGCGDQLLTFLDSHCSRVSAEERGPGRRLADEPHPAREPPQGDRLHAGAQVRRAEQARGRPGR